MLTLQVTMDLGAMALKWDSTFLKAQAFLKPLPSDCFISYPEHFLMRGFIPMQRFSWLVGWLRSLSYGVSTLFGHLKPN